MRRACCVLPAFRKVEAATGTPPAAEPTYADLMKALVEKTDQTDGWVQQYRDGPEALEAKEAVAQAKARGITVPPLLIARADEVIE